MVHAGAPSFLFRNTVLQNLNSQSLERLHLRPVTVESGQQIVAAGDSLRSLLFLESGSAAIHVALADGSLMETAMLGSRSIVGVGALLGTLGAGRQIVGRSPGHGLVCSLKNARQEFALSSQFHDLALGCLHAELFQTSQTAACNGRHDVEQRICRWLLRCEDESSMECIHVTHEALGEALGIGRPTVTLALDQLRAQGFISSKRGQISLENRPALLARACECYRILRDGLSLTSLPHGFPAHRQLHKPPSLSTHPSEPILQRSRSTKAEWRSDRYIQ